MGRRLLTSCHEHLEVLILTVWFALVRTTVPTQAPMLSLLHSITCPQSVSVHDCTLCTKRVHELSSTVPLVRAECSCRAPPFSHISPDMSRDWDEVGGPATCVARELLDDVGDSLGVCSAIWAVC
jgi:hypothetical protein